MKSLSRHAWLSWASVSVLAVLCGALGYLQYRWTGQITEAERGTLYSSLRSRLATFSRMFNEEVTEALNALQPASGQIETVGREEAYSSQYLRWKQTHGPWFQRIALAVPNDRGELGLLNLDLGTAQFTPGEWSRGWFAMRENLVRKLASGRGSAPYEQGAIFELPRFDRGREQEWLIVELNTEYMTIAVLPELLKRHLGEGGHVDYDIDVVDTSAVEDGVDPHVVYRSSPPHAPVLSDNSDAATPLLEIRSGRGPGRQGAAPGPPPGPGPEPPRMQHRGPGPPGGGGSPARWRMLVRHRAGSLEALVVQARRRNLGISAAVLLLILITVSMLVRLSRQAQRLAELQISFVAGVSHELRTPLTVIRTCAYNLRNPGFRSRTDQVERYGQLIEAESEKLETLVEQVLRFASAEAGHAVRERAPADMKGLIEDELAAKRSLIESRRVFLEERIGNDLPLVLADERALRHVFHNLFENALKYGIQAERPGSSWMGVYAEAFSDRNRQFVEIRVADRGPGIPPDEQRRIFDAFYRGRRAVQDQVHGTGLGLNLVKKIIEAHGGTVHVRSEDSTGTEFIVRLPVLKQ